MSLNPPPPHTHTPCIAEPHLIHYPLQYCFSPPIHCFILPLFPCRPHIPTLVSHSASHFQPHTPFVNPPPPPVSSPVSPPLPSTKLHPFLHPQESLFLAFSLSPPPPPLPDEGSSSPRRAGVSVPGPILTATPSGLGCGGAAPVTPGAASRGDFRRHGPGQARPEVSTRRAGGGRACWWPPASGCGMGSVRRLKEHGGQGSLACRLGQARCFWGRNIFSHCSPLGSSIPGC